VNRRGNPDKIKPYQFKPGQSGNPGGRPRGDLARELARAIFENNSELIYETMLRALKNGDFRVFAVLAERAYGKTRSHDPADDFPAFLSCDGIPIPSEFRDRAREISQGLPRDKQFLDDRKIKNEDVLDKP
jgi:hypothetical protein